MDALACECCKYAISFICTMLCVVEAGARTHTGLPTPKQTLSWVSLCRPAWMVQRSGGLGRTGGRCSGVEEDGQWGDG